MSTVLVTGASGYIAKHIVRELVEQGHAVRASTRSEKRRAEIGALFPDAEIDYVSLDLTSDEGWTEALDGVDVLMHTASPLPSDQPKDPQELIRPAVDGTKRALRAAHRAGVHRVILTSSVAAVFKGANLTNGTTLNESDWTDPNSPRATAYDKSKTLAERAAWEFVAEHGEMKLTTINPGGVFGPAMDMNYGALLGYVERFLDGGVPMVANLTFSIVDVRDVARMHVAAMDQPESSGERFIASAGDVSMVELARLLAEAYPDRKISTRKAPDFLIRGIATFVPMLRAVVQNLGMHNPIDGTKASTTFGFTYITPQEAVLESARYLVTNGK
ncbi:MAG: aldehyde reductase [Acidimicrobiaceae bacterium]|jgi:dihydroflavonol-4-reductase|nr:aldehyde reductase [Acidimicrobiaceae bacterium]